MPIEHDDHTTRAIARLPGLDIAIEHRRLDDAERISIHLQAAPSFAAFSDALGIANPFAFWARSAQFAFLPWLAWSPWLTASRALLSDANEAPPTAPEA